MYSSTWGRGVSGLSFGLVIVLFDSNNQNNDSDLLELVVYKVWKTNKTFYTFSFTVDIEAQRAHATMATTNNYIAASETHTLSSNGGCQCEYK